MDLHRFQVRPLAVRLHAGVLAVRQTYDQPRVSTTCCNPPIELAIAQKSAVTSEGSVHRLPAS
jgi:hypothetical protein